MRKLGKERLREVAKHILAVPQRIDMGIAICYRGKDDNNYGWRFPECGTIGCIAGWTQELFGSNKSVDLNKPVCWPRIHYNAIELLDPSIPTNEWDKLFYVAKWSTVLHMAYDKAANCDDYQRMAEVTVQAIEEFIKTH